MERGEALHFLRYREVGGHYMMNLARAYGISTRRKYVSVIVKEVYQRILDGAPEEPAIPEPPVQPEPAPEPEQPAAVCDGCGGVGDTPRFLRWGKVARGEAVTVSVDYSGKPASLNWLTDQIIKEQWLSPWEEDTSLRFEMLESDKGDIHIKFEPIDGVGGTLGFAYLPNQNVEFMESGGDLSGDIVIDSSERWEPVQFMIALHDLGLIEKTELTKFKRFGKKKQNAIARALINSTGDHEIGHAIGVPHSEDPEDPMYPVAQSERKSHNDTTKRAKTLRYPPKQVAA